MSPTHPPTAVPLASHAHTQTRADIGGLPLAELNALELEFLLAIDFRLAVAPADFARIAGALLDFSATRGGPPRHCRPRPARGRSASLAQLSLSWGSSGSSLDAPGAEANGAGKARSRRVSPAPYDPPGRVAGVVTRR